MHNFKRAICNTIIYILIVFAIALILPVVYLHFCETNWTSKSDMSIRNMYAGEVDTIFLSYSHGLNAFIPEIYDSYLGTNSYNCSSSLCTMRGRDALMQQELGRNPVRSVVLEVSYDIMSSNPYRVEGDSLVVQRLSGANNRIRYLLGSIDIDNIPMHYYYMFHSGLSMITDRLSYDLVEETDKAKKNKGFIPLSAIDMNTHPEADLYRGKKGDVSEEIDDVNEKYLRHIIEECQSRGIDIILVTAPLAKVRTEYYQNLNAIRDYYMQIAEEYNISYYDMNLVMQDILDDSIDFADTEHMSYEGAQKCTEAFAQTVLSNK